MRIGQWFQRWRQGREARRILARIFSSPEVLETTSLKPHHRGRCVLLNYQCTRGQIRQICFGILRHPRPYPFSRQSHNVLEGYRYEVADGKLHRLKGYNLTRAREKDAD